MTAQGGDILAWLDNAITKREGTARDASDGPWWVEHPRTVWGPGPDIEVATSGGTVATLPEDGNGMLNALHVVANDPESVLRRCAADRKLIQDILADTHFVSQDDEHFTCLAATVEHDGGEHANRHRNPDAECDCGRDERVARYLDFLAEGYGWKQTPPTEGDQVT